METTQPSPDTIERILTFAEAIEEGIIPPYGGEIDPTALAAYNEKLYQQYACIDCGEFSCSCGKRQQDARIRVVDSRAGAPPCEVTIQRNRIMGTWKGRCACGHWAGPMALGNTFASETAARAAATAHLRSMDRARGIA